MTERRTASRTPNQLEAALRIKVLVRCFGREMLDPVPALKGAAEAVAEEVLRLGGKLPDPVLESPTAGTAARREVRIQRAATDLYGALRALLRVSPGLAEVACSAAADSLESSLHAAREARKTFQNVPPARTRRQR